MMMLILLFFMFISGLISFALKREHLLLMLLSLEFIVVSLYFIFMVYLKMMNYEYFFSMVFLTMSVCEGTLGLSILVSMIRAYGNDNILTFSFLW
uniref:NADH-ubiquinone oxidoreductase chain 4L n=1 Tax=Callosobruchus maculatus TaxID=64391 RepID=A0A7M3UIR7_CALMS|nr:NADH dehydrogenase subunit 4L [Callosobruchus maculatus]YP_010876300.1 NADH dehydrogenase subunit 4L [Bruchus pisorum]QOH99482.1 NADH dehydrogenase subunit 4L [Callosobruchus maculatus]WHE17351.1 NADH dehydrogenase subunit 4L [Bruchus pisorum]